MNRNPAGVRFSDLCKVCDFYFGKARQRRSSHRIYRTPWPNDPRVVLQPNGKMAKRYQVIQVIAAIKKLEQLDEKYH